MKSHAPYRAAAAIMAIVAVSGLASVRAADAPTTAVDGKALVFDRGKGNCLACHAVAGGDVASTVGPPLANIKSRFPDRKELFGIIWDETKRNPQTAMPPFGRNRIVTKDEIEKIVDYLYTL